MRQTKFTACNRLKMLAIPRNNRPGHTRPRQLGPPTGVQSPESGVLSWISCAECTCIIENSDCSNLSPVKGKESTFPGGLLCRLAIEKSVDNVFQMTSTEAPAPIRVECVWRSYRPKAKCLVECPLSAKSAGKPDAWVGCLESRRHTFLGQPLPILNSVQNRT